MEPFDVRFEGSAQKNAEQLSYFTVEYGNTTSNYIECGTAPSMESFDISDIFHVNVRDFTLYCSDPQLARYLKITTPNSILKNTPFELCEIEVFATREGMCNIEFFMRRSNCSHFIPRASPGSEEK